MEGKDQSSIINRISKTIFLNYNNTVIASHREGKGDGAKQSADKIDSASNKEIASPPTHIPSQARNDSKIIKISDKFYLPQSISYTKEITLSYKESVFTIEFAGLHYANPEKNQYAYKLEGFDEDWNYVGTRRFATYTNLDAGKYIFKLKGSNNDGVWIEENNGNVNIFNLTITPPWWETWWFNTSWIV